MTNISTDSQGFVEPLKFLSGMSLRKWGELTEKPVGLMGVAINSLGKVQSERIKKHLKSLGSQDRYMRFGYPASDDQIDQYVENLDFDSDDIYGIFNIDMELIAMAHLALPKSNSHLNQAEFGVSVSENCRGRGYGGRLFERASIHAVNNKIKTIYIHALSENAPMLKIAKKHGAVLHREGSETEAYVELGKPTIDTQLMELMSEQYARTNYDIKNQMKKFWDFIKDVQEIRDGVKVARHKSSS